MPHSPHPATTTATEPPSMTLAELHTTLFSLLDPRSTMNDSERMAAINIIAHTRIKDFSSDAIREMHAVAFHRLELGLTLDEINEALEVALEQADIDRFDSEEVGVAMVMAHADQGSRTADEIGKLLRRVLMDQTKFRALATHATRTVEHRDKRRELLKNRARMQQLAQDFRAARARGDDETANTMAMEIQKIFTVAFPLACEMLQDVRAARR